MASGSPQEWAGSGEKGPVVLLGGVLTLVVSAQAWVRQTQTRTMAASRRSRR